MKEKKAQANLIANGKCELVVPEADSYQALLEVKDRKDTIEGIKNGLKSMKGERGKSATDFFREFFAEKGIPEHQ